MFVKHFILAHYTGTPSHFHFIATHGKDRGPDGVIYRRSISKCVAWPDWNNGTPAYYVILYPTRNYIHHCNQWETTLQYNVVSHWLGAYTKWSLLHRATYLHGTVLCLVFDCYSQHVGAGTNGRGFADDILKYMFVLVSWLKFHRSLLLRV